MMQEAKKYLVFSVMLLCFLCGIAFLVVQSEIYREAYILLSKFLEHTSITVKTGE